MKLHSLMLCQTMSSSVKSSWLHDACCDDRECQAPAAHRRHAAQKSLVCSLEVCISLFNAQRETSAWRTAGRHTRWRRL